MLNNLILSTFLWLLFACSSTNTGTQESQPISTAATGEITIEEVKLTAKNLVYVKLPDIIASALNNFQGSGWTKERFTYSLQTKIIDEMDEHLVKLINLITNNK